MKLKLDYKRCHEGLWNWLAKNPSNGKIDWPGWETIIQYDLDDGITLSTRCFACGHCGQRCLVCPVNFGKQFCEEDNAYFDKWKEAETNKTRTKYALLIARGWK